MKQRFFIYLVIGGILFVALSRDAHGWGKTWIGRELENSVNDAWLEIGPFRIKTLLWLNNAGYDSNVYRRPYDPVKDYTLTFGPGFYLYWLIKKTVVFEIYDSPQYVYFKETKRERTWNNYFNGKVHFVFNRVLFTFGKGYSVAREIWNTEIDIRPQRKEDSYYGSFLWQATKKTSFYLRFRRAEYDYEDLSFERFNIRDELNREENTVNFTAYYQLSYRTRLFFDFEFGYFDFDDPSNIRDSQSYGIFGGFEFSPLGVVRGRINLGYKGFYTLSAGGKDYQGIVGDTSVSVRFLRPLSVRVSYRRDIEFSVWYGNPYFIENRYGTGASVYLFKNVRLDYDYNLGRNQYTEVIRVGETSYDKRRDDYEIHAVGLYFRLKENVAIGVVARRWIRDSNLDWWDGDRDFIGVNLTYDF
jgi:hypothetical protein